MAKLISSKTSNKFTLHSKERKYRFCHGLIKKNKWDEKIDQGD